uniref:Retrovirus-related Pol polyprotein from transposon TNT 1-94 n=1 Tax=Cajanus cajan TaxID=3821 RepID=A0A151UFE4_CAJCA
MAAQSSAATSSIVQPLVPVSIKLDDDNFLIWKMQATGIIKSFKLHKYVDHHKDGGMPPKYSNPKDKLLDKVSETYSNWEQQDQLIFTWLLTSMSPNLHSRMVGYVHAFQIWQSLHLYFETQTRARVCQLKSQLKGIKKQDSLNSYLLSIKKIIDTLALVGSLVDPAKHIQIIPDGLPSEYNPLVTSIISRTDPYSVTEIETLLTTMENRLERQKQEEQESLNIGRGQQNHRGRNKGNFRGGKSFGRAPSRGYDKQNNYNRPICQVCNKPGHTALNCYHRFNPQYQDSSAQQVSNYSETQQKAMVTEANLDDQSNVSALMAVPDTFCDLAWYPDTGATNHITANASNMAGKSTYTGETKLKMTNGDSTSIQHIGHSYLYSSNSNKPLFLKNLLHVPSISKNLISVSQFCRDNNVKFEFTANNCCVKSQDSKHTLLEGHFTKGLYVFYNISVGPSVCNSVTTENSNSIRELPNNKCDLYRIWHAKLGHVNYKIVHDVMNKCGVSVSKNSTFSLCKSCCLGKLHKKPFYYSTTVYTSPLQLIYTNIWGPAPIPSSSGSKYYIEFIDAFFTIYMDLLDF